jgi:YD repeat-containing protein
MRISPAVPLLLLAGALAACGPAYRASAAEPAAAEPAAEARQQSRRYIGVWALVDNANNLFNLRLRPNGRAITTAGVEGTPLAGSGALRSAQLSEQGRWRPWGNGVRIDYPDGWTDALLMGPSGPQQWSWEPGADRLQPPSNHGKAVRLDGPMAAVVGVYSFQPGLYRRNTGVQDGTENRSREYDPATGRLIRSTDKRGVVTEYEYAAGHRSATIEAVGTPQQRREEIDRDPATQRVLEMRTKDAAGALVARTTMAYNSRGQVTSVTAHDPATGASRTSATAYCEPADLTAGTCPLVGLVKSIDGPRSDVADVATFTYRQTDHPDCAAAPTTCAWRKGDLWKTTNALGHVTEVLAFDGAGRVTSIKDAHGTVTALEYDPRGWLIKRTQFGALPEIVFDEAVTTIQYTADGLVRKLTERDNSFTLFGYDAGQRLTTVADSDGNAIVYTLNAAGERIAERTYDPTGALTRVCNDPCG